MMRKERKIVELEVEKKNILECTNVSQYIELIRSLVEYSSQKIVVYRGEPEVYSTPCRPNIFRKGVLNNNRLYERSLFDTMRQNGLTSEKRYLDNAIDAQHGEFPSRLLDVTYNCLVALYFAVTAFYHRGDDADDDKDGMVYIFYIDDIYSPSAKNTNQVYNAIINKNVPWFTDELIFEKNHKFIDHCKLNKRIVAQQGAFILFQGNDATPIPKYMHRGILIPKKYKPSLRNELKLYFGIHTGSIYPEITNLANELNEKSKKIVNKDFSCKNEFSQVMETFQKELDYYFDYLLECYTEFCKDKSNIQKKVDYYEAVDYVEKLIKSYRIGLMDYGSRMWEKCQNLEGGRDELENVEKELKEAIKNYQKKLYNFQNDIDKYNLEGISVDKLGII